MLCLWLVLVGAIHAPAALALDATENRVWKKIDAPPQTRLVETSQVAGSHQENLPPSWGTVSGCCLSAKEAGAGIKYIGKVDDLAGIPRSQTLLDDLPNLGSPRANYYQNSSVLRKALRDGYEIRDASAFRLNSSPDPTLLRPDRTIGQSFLGAERNILDNKGLIMDLNGVYGPR